jgi:hypothetical protein
MLSPDLVQKIQFSLFYIFFFYFFYLFRGLQRIEIQYVSKGITDIYRSNSGHLSGTFADIYRGFLGGNCGHLSGRCGQAKKFVVFHFFA